jgi:hypothetical protein
MLTVKQNFRTLAACDPLWERPCVAKGLQSSPGNLYITEILGLLRSPFATQGRSHNDRADLQEQKSRP